MLQPVVQRCAGRLSSFGGCSLAHPMLEFHGPEWRILRSHGAKLIQQALDDFVPAIEELARLDVAELEPVEKPNEPFS